VEIERAFRERISRLGDVAHEGRQGLQLSPVAAPLAKDVLDGLEVVAPLPWKQLIERVEKASKVTPKPPKKLAATLRDYQLEGYRWLWRLSQMGAGGVLADDMGLGKTVQAIAMLVERAELGPQLVLAPTSVGMNWHREIERFAPTLKPIDFRTADREQIVEHARSGDVIIASYGLLRQDLEALQSRTWATLIFDEAHAFKNYATQTAKAVRSLKADWKLALTGTPMENHLGELYSLMHTVCPGLFGTWENFAFGFAKPIEKDKDSERRNALARLLQPFILRRTKAQVLTELPPRTEIRLDVVLSKQERAMYEAMRLAALSSMEEADETIDQRFIVLAALTRLRQISSHARMIEPTAPKLSAKQTVLMEQLEEVLEEGHTALVFSQFTSQLKLLEEEMHARKLKTLYLDGTTPAGERRKRVDAFQRGDAPIFLVSLKAGGTGLNLTAADYVFLMDPWWNPAVEDQAADRAHRIGQTRPVTIVRLVASGTVEEKVLSLHAKKRQLVASVLDGADAAGKLNTEELIDLLREGQKPSSKPTVGVIEQEKRRRSRNLGPRAKGK
jgi:SNF2 family DNA or RNA helicase